MRRSAKRGDRDIWIEDGRKGLPEESLVSITALRASASHLHLGNYDHQCHAVPWTNILSEADHPVTVRQDTCF